LELLGICSLVTEENFTKTKSLNHFAIFVAEKFLVYAGL